MLEHHALGDQQIFNQRYRTPLLFTPVYFEGRDAIEVYLRVQTGSSVQVPLTLWDVDAFAINDSNRTILQGMYYGVMIVIALYNLLMFAVLVRHHLPLLRGVCHRHAAVSGQNLSRADLFTISGPKQIRWNDQSVVAFLGG